MPILPNSPQAYGRRMNATRPRFAAAVLLTIGGLLSGMAAVAIGIASLAVHAGLAAQPHDALLLDDLVAVLPFIVAFVAFDLATARGLATGKGWAMAAGPVLALGAVTMGVLGLLILVVGNDPAALTGAVRASEGDGLGLAAGFTGLHLAALIALRVDGAPFRALRPATA
jgi:hypothetical protein